MCCCMPYFAALIRHHQTSFGFFKSLVFAGYRHTRSVFQARSSSGSKHPRTQPSLEGKFVKIDHSKLEKLPQIWNQNKKTPSSSTAIMSASVGAGSSEDLPVENEIRVRSNLLQAWTSVLLRSMKEDLV